MHRVRRWAAVFVLSAGLSAGAWLVGFITALEVVPAPTRAPANVETPNNFALYDEAWGIVRSEFYGEVPLPSDVTVGAVDGLLRALADPYAAYLSPESAANASRATMPAVVGGIGAWVEPVPDGALVVSIVPGTPAEETGLTPQDIILATDGEGLDGLDRDEVLERLDGEPGTSVVLTVYRPGADPFEVEVVRDRFELPLLEVRQPVEGVIDLRMSRFESPLDDELAAALATANQADPTGIIVDLRDNPGGDLETLRRVASRFVDGPLWIEKSRRPDKTVTSLEVPGARFEGTRVVVLINGGTASAAELLAAILRESAGATLVGQPTFGKSTVQGIMQLQDRSVLKLTVAEWTTPGGVSVAEAGLQPDRAVASADEQLATAAQVAGGLATAGG